MVLLHVRKSMAKIRRFQDWAVRIHLVVRSLESSHRDIRRILRTSQLAVSELILHSLEVPFRRGKLSGNWICQDFCQFPCHPQILQLQSAIAAHRDRDKERERERKDLRSGSKIENTEVCFFTPARMGTVEKKEEKRNFDYTKIGKHLESGKNLWKESKYF